MKFRGKRDTLESQASEIESVQTRLNTFSLSCILHQLSKGSPRELKYCRVAMLAVTEGTQSDPLETNALNQPSGD